MIANQKSFVYRSATVLGEVIGLNLIMLAIRPLFEAEMPQYSALYPQFMFIVSICYAVCGLQTGSRLHFVFIRGDEILRRALYSNIFFDILIITLSLALPGARRQVWGFLLPLLIGQLLFSLLFKKLVRIAIQYRRAHLQPRKCFVVVGPLNDVYGLIHALQCSKETGFEMTGYFAAVPDEDPQFATLYLGTLQEGVPYIEAHSRDIYEIFCTLSSAETECIQQLVNACDNYLIRFIGIPGTYNFIAHRISAIRLDNGPAVALVNSPLENTDNAFVKRAFDVVVSALLLVTVFPPIFLFFACWIKLSSRGPVFFRQQRSGLNGKDFECLKFRSMRVNDSSDTQQATKNDPRKTKVGNFMRRTNIDELPQLINVLRGEMSLVGPRPHMLVHTAQYRSLIDKYMIRHTVRPGITGWAQVTGFRGETRELWQMEGRVRKDIWYIQHWSFVLDLWILIKTILTIRWKNAY